MVGRVVPDEKWPWRVVRADGLSGMANLSRANDAAVALLGQFNAPAPVSDRTSVRASEPEPG
jgi:hypothetical protein